MSTREGGEPSTATTSTATPVTAGKAASTTSSDIAVQRPSTVQSLSFFVCCGALEPRTEHLDYSAYESDDEEDEDAVYTTVDQNDQL